MVLNKLLEGIAPRPWLGEDWRPLSKIHPEHGGDDGNGSGGALVSFIAGDFRNAGWDVLEACGDGASPRVYRIYGDSRGVQEGLDLRLQVWKRKS